MDALKLLKSSEPQHWLGPSSSLSAASREASSFLFSSLKPHAPKCPFDQLLVQGFDAEQIWQQIDIQSQPLLASLSRQLAYFQANTHEIEKFPDTSNVCETTLNEEKGNNTVDSRVDDPESEEFEEQDGDGLEETEDEDDENDMPSNDGEIEDKFLKINELEQYLEEDEAREYGLDSKKENSVSKKRSEDEDSESDISEMEQEEESDEDEDEELGEFGEEGEDDDDTNLRYEDFFSSNNEKKGMKNSKLGEENLDSDEEGIYKEKKDLSTYEKELQKVQSEIEKMEKANLEPKAWIMQGEVTASKRPVNSALEVDLEFEHNIRPAPVITEEVSANLEEMIKNRIIENQFDELEKVAKLTPKAPKDVKEIDDNKSKKGLGEVYEEEYVQKTNPFAAAVSFSDELKKEASLLFKKLCLHLDALSHFHFAPKPIIEDMSIQSNVPALAIEEIAPIAVSDATMLAPEEVFEGKGDFKEETELTRSDRKKRRAQKKRKFKAREATRMVKAKPNSVPNKNSTSDS